MPGSAGHRIIVPYKNRPTQPASTNLDLAKYEYETLGSFRPIEFVVDILLATPVAIPYHALLEVGCLHEIKFLLLDPFICVGCGRAGRCGALAT